ncbi:hypothetical protein [Rathayibacter sp. VKM Ac-2927]|uniref:DUF7882 family protein n=1 Tax=Rathayibacter sp. VKM Ac-2927 TaxID=2929478 RepID=UPI001FB215A5|nr:hypothetical protein [Rathayibacter sp. VKM Ac-2927]MCJ1688566.1 hypothetical protein [Rathayibacter sp. VKM Ac-2927]
MGFLHYNDRSFELDDRLLHHVQTVTAVKLRRHECFFLGWMSGSPSGSGRQSVWIGVGIPIHFEYFGGRVPALNREWIEQLMTSANSSAGLALSDERNREPSSTA